VTVVDLDDAVFLGPFRGHRVCAVRAGGTAVCWGDPDWFWPWYPTDTRPRPVAGLEGVVRISAGLEHGCATLADGSAYCWGENGDGRVGDGLPSTFPFPVEPVGL
jgi:hypothetical protein